VQLIVFLCENSRHTFYSVKQLEQREIRVNKHPRYIYACLVQSARGRHGANYTRSIAALHCHTQSLEQELQCSDRGSAVVAVIQLTLPIKPTAKESNLFIHDQKIRSPILNHNAYLK